MPVFKVTDPQTGRTLKLTGDSPPTEQELNQIFSSTGGQGGIDANRNLPSTNVSGNLGAFGEQGIQPIDFSGVVADPQRTFPKTPEGERARFAAQTGAGESLLVGAGKGLRSFARGVEQLGTGGEPGLVEQIQQASQAGSFGAAKEKRAAATERKRQDIARREQEDVAATAELKAENPLAFGVGEAAPSLIAGGGLSTGTIKTAATIGGTEGLLKFAPTAKDRVINTAIGAGVGGLGEGAAKLIKKVFSPKLFDRNTGQLTEGGQKILEKNFGSVEQAAEKIGPLKERLAELAQRGQINKTDIVNIGKDLGIPVMTSDLFPPENIISGGFRALSEKIPFFGTGAKRGAQQKARVAAANKVLDDFGVDVDSRSIVDNLAASVERRKRLAGDRINKFVGRMNEVGEIQPDIILKEIDNQITNLSKAGRVTTPQSEAALKNLQNLKDEISSAPGSFETLRNDRTAWRDIAEQAESSGRSQFSGPVKASLDRVYDSFTRQLDDSVRRNLDEKQLLKYKGADKVYREEALSMTKSKLKNVLDKGQITPEAVETLFSATAKPSDIRRLFRSLSAEGRSATRAGIISSALKKSTFDGVVNPTTFTKQLEKLDTPIQEFFRGSERKKILGLKKLLDATKRAQDAGVITPTGQIAQATTQTGLIGGAATGLQGFPELLAGQAATGALGRVYESSATRNMLIRLANAKAGSRAEQELLTTLGDSLASQLSQRATRAGALGIDETGGQ